MAAVAQLLLLLVTAAVVYAQPAPPPLTAPVNDFAHVIDAESAREMDRIIRALEKATGDAIVVATIDTFAPYADLREYAVKMFENGGRGIGQRGQENGVLIVAAIKDRQARIEVGYGLEEFITDGFAGDTYRTSMQPAFREGRYGAGLLAAVQRLAGRLAAARNVSLDGIPAAEVETASGRPNFMTWLIFALIIWTLLGGGRRRRRRFGGSRSWGGAPWSGWSSGVGTFGGGSSGGFGGGFGGFGGGRSGGGGGGGGW